MKKLLVISLVMTFIYLNVHSQNIDDARSNSMGRTSVSNSFNIGAFDNNPANLIFNQRFDDSKYHIGLFSSVGYVLNSDFFSYDFYDGYLTGDGFGNKKVLTDEEKNDVFSKSRNTESNAGLSFKLLAFVYQIDGNNSVGLSVSDKMLGKGYVPEDFASIALFGNKKNTLYDISEFNLSYLRYRQVNLTYARLFDDVDEGLSAGVSVKPTFGFQFIRTNNNSITLFTNDSNQITGTGDAVFRTAGMDNDFGLIPGFGNIAGFGLGFDLGVNWKFSEQFNAGLSFTDLGWITWNDNTKDEYYNGDMELTDLSESHQLDSLLNLLRGQKILIGDFNSSLPLNLRVGATYRIFESSLQGSETGEKFERANITLEYLQGFSDRIAGSTLTPRVSVGSEIFLGRMFLLRGGIIGGGMDKFAASLGVGFRFEPVSIDVGTHNILSLADPKNSSRNSFIMTITAAF